MKTKFLSLLTIVAVLTSCIKDKGTVSFTYNKAIAIYGDLEEIRSTPLNEEKRAIEDAGKIFIGEEVLLIGEENKGIHVFNNSNPALPINEGFINLPHTKEFFVKDGFIYAESHYDMLKIDIRDLSNPVLVSRVRNAFGNPILNSAGKAVVGFRYEVATESFEISSEEGKALKESEFLYYDEHESLIPPSAVPASFVAAETSSIGTINRVAAHNGYVYVVGKHDLHVFQDGSNGLTYIDNNYYGTSYMETVYPKGNYLFIGTETSMEVVDISNPASPRNQSGFEHAKSCDPVYPNGNATYVTLRTADFSVCPGNTNALVVVNTSNINKPTQQEEIPMASPYGMNLHNNLLYVGEGQNGMSIFDATDPLNLKFIRSDKDVEVYDIIPHPTIPNLILTTGSNGISQYEVNETTKNLKLIGYINY